MSGAGILQHSGNRFSKYLSYGRDTAPPPSGGGDGTWVARATDPPAITHWWNPKTGSDTNDGLTAGNAYLTFVYAVDQTVAAGGVLGIVDNTYTSADPGLSTGDFMATYIGLAPASRLWIRADTERQAIFECAGAGSFYLHQASNVSLWGITIDSVDDNTKTGVGAVLWCRLTTDVHLYRILIAKVNNAVDQHGILVSSATRPYMEECEVYDYYRHGYSLHRSVQPHMRRCYANARMATATNDNLTHTTNQNYNEGISGYRSNGGLFENCVVEGGADYRIQCDYTDGEIKSYNQLCAGLIMNGGRDINPTDFRAQGSHWNNVTKHFLVLNSTENGIDISTDFQRFENGTIAQIGAGTRTAIRVESFDTHNFDATSTTAYQSLTGESPATSRARVENTNIFSNPHGAYEEVNGGIVRDLAYCNLHGNGGPDTGSDPLNTRLNDADLIANLFTNSQSTDPTTGVYGLNFSGGQTVVYIPSGHPLENAGNGEGIDGHIGCTILHRYEGNTNEGALPTETLTSTPLWNPDTGQFPHGAVIPGKNDQDGTGSYNRDKCLSTLHTRLGVSAATLPSGYGG